MALPGAPDSCILQCAGHFILTLCHPSKEATGSFDNGVTSTDTPVEVGILTEVIFTGYCTRKPQTSSTRRLRTRSWRNS